MSSPRITIVVPTFKEAENLPYLIDRVARVRETRNLDIDLVIVDDDSRDGSMEIIRSRPGPWVQMIVRTADRGLARLDGMRPQAAAVAGIAAGTSFNFLTSRYLVFRLSYVRPLRSVIDDVERVFGRTMNRTALS